MIKKTMLVLMIIFLFSGCGSTGSFSQLKTAEVGDIITFGSYEQDNDTTNGAEPITWYVLEKTDTQIKVLSEYALDTRRFNDTEDRITWDMSSIRTWLNDSFLDIAFTEKEQKKIIETRNVTEGAPNPAEYAIRDSADTMDKVFLLSIDEAVRLPNHGIAYATDYALAYHAKVCKEGGSPWWLRTAGFNSTEACYVWGDGSINYGAYACKDDFTVRPAIWIDIS